MEKKFIKVDFVDNEYDYGTERVMDTYILVNPNMEKLKELQILLNNRFDENNQFESNYQAIYDYITENFEVLEIHDFIEIEW